MSDAPVDRDMVGWFFTLLGGSGLLGAIMRGHGTQREHAAKIAALEKLSEASGVKLDRAAEAIASLTASVSTLANSVAKMAESIDRVHERIDEVVKR